MKKRLLTETIALCNFSHNIRTLRIRNKKKLTQQMLARRLHLSRSTISRFENGEQMPSAITAINLSRYFETTVETMFGCQMTNEGRDETE